MKKRIMLISIPILLILIFSILVFLFYDGIIKINTPSKEDYPVRGVDISRYQGEIDWEVLAEQDISFAFIKATEGSGHIDPYYKKT